MSRLGHSQKAKIIDGKGNEGTTGRVIQILIKGVAQNAGQVRGLWGFSQEIFEKLTIKRCNSE